MSENSSDSSWPSDDEDPATLYALLVVHDQQPAGKWVRLACERHLRDRAAADRGEGRWRWRPELGNRAIGLFKLFRHYKGKWGGQPVVLELWQKFIVASIFGWVDRSTGLRRFRNAFVEMTRGQGKALAIDTPIPTTNGWKAHGDLQPGDYVFSPDGSSVMVQAVTDAYDGPCMEVRTSDGASIVAHERHEWDTFRTWFTKRPNGSRKPLPTVETREIAATLRGGSRRDLVHRLAVTGPLKCPTVVLPVPPYTFGAWLGDGHSASARLTVADVEIVQRIRSEGVPVSEKDYTGDGKAKTYAFTDGRRSQSARNQSVAARLREMGVLGHKRIPTSYLRSSESQRLELLRGLMDTDGHVVADGQCEIVTIGQELANDISELVSTLGHKPTVCVDRARLNGRDIGPRYRVRFYQLTDEAVASLPRKLRRLRRATSIGRRRTITSVQPCGTRTVNCIQVQGGKYLAGRSFVPTHNSTLAAGILIILTFFDNESGAEGYSFATKKDQARIVFKTARQMVLRSPALKDLITVLRHNLHQEETESKLEALGANEDTLDGLRPHVAIGDEIHKHKTADLVEVIESGMGTREQPLLFNITTAGEADGIETVYGQQVSISAQVLEGHAKGFDIPEWFAFMASADVEDDWSLETTWIKANPNWGVSVNPEFVHKEFRKALANPAEQPKFRRLYLGQRVQAVDAYFSIVDWDECPKLPPDDELRKYPSWIGLDLSSSVDVTAAVQIWKLASDEIAIRPMLWIPEDGLEDRRRKDKVPYPQWVEEGHIFTTPGNTIDRAAIRRKVAEVAKAWKVKAICYDPWHADEMVQAMQDEDKLTLVQVPQRFAMLSEPTKSLQTMILRRRARHDKNPVMRWMIGNAKPRIDDRENVMLCKKRSRGRIDGAQATCTGLHQVKIFMGKKSVYAERGVISL